MYNECNTYSRGNKAEKIIYKADITFINIDNYKI